MRLQEIKTGDQLQMELIRRGFHKLTEKQMFNLPPCFSWKEYVIEGVRQTEIAFAPNCGDWSGDLTVVAELSPDDRIRKWRCWEGYAGTEMRVDDLGAVDFDHLDEFLQTLRRAMKP